MGADRQRILLVYNSRSEYERIAYPLSDTGFECSHAHCAQEAVEELANGQHSAVVVHQGAVGDALADFCQDARSADANLLIIPSLTHHDESVDLELLNRGVDDVVTDQHCPAAVAKRVAIRLVSRRTLDLDCDMIHIGEAVVDFVNGRIQRDGEYIAMSVREAKLLKYLIANAGKTVSRLNVLHWVWSNSVVDPIGKNVDMYISRLRKLIEPDCKKPIYLKTVYGRGYKLDLPGGNG